MLQDAASHPGPMLYKQEKIRHSVIIKRLDFMEKFLLFYSFKLRFNQLRLPTIPFALIEKQVLFRITILYILSIDHDFCKSLHLLDLVLLQ